MKTMKEKLAKLVDAVAAKKAKAIVKKMLAEKEGIVKTSAKRTPKTKKEIVTPAVTRGEISWMAEYEDTTGEDEDAGVILSFEWLGQPGRNGEMFIPGNIISSIDAWKLSDFAAE
jgi:hypothetical protein